MKERDKIKAVLNKIYSLNCKSTTKETKEELIKLKREVTTLTKVR